MKKINNPYVRAFLNIVLYIIVFIVLQAVMLQLSMLLGKHYSIDTDRMIAIATALSGLLTICLFARLRWSPYSREYISKRPWTTLAWVAMLALGTIVPSQWLVEVMGFEMPKESAELLTQMMKTPWGYMAVGVLAPVAEEMVMRGAVLRKLLEVMGGNLKWLAIVISALVFGTLHGNIPQFVHATLMGVLLGWMYSRTDSIVPGIVFHWVNNTIAFIAFHLLPQAQDGTLSDIFGDGGRVYMALGFSLCVFLPSLLQLVQRLRK